MYISRHLGGLLLRRRPTKVWQPNQPLHVTSYHHTLYFSLLYRSTTHTFRPSLLSPPPPLRQKPSSRHERFLDIQGSVARLHCATSSRLNHSSISRWADSGPSEAWTRFRPVVGIVGRTTNLNLHGRNITGYHVLAWRRNTRMAERKKPPRRVRSRSVSHPSRALRKY